MQTISKDEQKLQPQQNRTIIILICGIPGSGKSSISKIIHEQFNIISNNNNNNNSSLYIDIDSIERQCYNIVNDEQLMKYQTDCDYVNILENQITEQILLQLQCNGIIIDHQIKYQFNPIIWKISRNVSQNVVNQIQQLQCQLMRFQNVKYIIVEDVFNLMSQRKYYYQLASQQIYFIGNINLIIFGQRYKIGFCEIHVCMELDDIIQFDKSRENYKQVGEEIINKMYHSFDQDPLSKDNYMKIMNNKQITLQDQINNNIIKQINEIGLQIVLIQNEQNKMNEQEYNNIIRINQENINHQLDLKLRDKVNSFMQNQYKSNIIKNGGGKGLSVLKKIYFYLQQEIIQQRGRFSQKSDLNEIGIISKEQQYMQLYQLEKMNDLEKEYNKIFKITSIIPKQYSFKEVIELIYNQIDIFKFDHHKFKQDNNYQPKSKDDDNKQMNDVQQKIENENLQLNENKINNNNNESHDNNNNLNDFIKEYTEFHSLTFEKVVQIIYSNND